MSRSVAKPIMIYRDKDGRSCLLWPETYKKGDKVEILKYLKEMARLVDEDKLKKSISSFELWKKDPGFVV
jgi:hypothetical protein